jgi:hypothetical protein
MAKRRRLAVGERPKLARGQARGTRPGRQRASASTVVTIRMGPRHFVHVARDEHIARLAGEWTYILRSRSRWSDDDETRQL